MANNRRSNFALATISFVISLAAQRGLPFFALPIVARATSQFEYGAATLAISIASVLSVIMTLGINAAMPRLYAQEGSTAKSASWVALALVQVAFAVVLVVAVGGAATVIGPAFLGADTQNFVLPALILAFASSIQMTYQGISIARGASSRLLIATLLQLAVGLTLAQILSTAFGGAGYIYALAFSSILATSLLAAFAHPKPDWRKMAVRAGLKLSMPFIGQGLSTWLLALFDRIVIGVLLGATQVGGYQVAYMAGSVLGMVLEGFQAAWGPRYHKSRYTHKKLLLARLLNPSIWLAAVMILLLCSAAPLLLPLIAPSYDVSYALVTLVALSSLPRGIYFVCIAALLNEGRSTSVMTSTLISAVFTVVAALMLIPQVGAIGGGVVTLAAFIIQSLIVLHRAFKWPLRRTVALVVGPVLGLGVLLVLGGQIAQLHPAMNLVLPILLVIPTAVVGWKSFKSFGSVLAGWQKDDG
ncbi:lipopolysaccharide biosynthesis protein [Pseudarthrobacter sp. S6]|uniref:lipopolysaccharide biosynthesis protein n=1 Tax=Pseudarthrobacter sp. S6 TaxID=3418420 RepID=UPI003CF9116B